MHRKKKYRIKMKNNRIVNLKRKVGTKPNLVSVNYFETDYPQGK